MIQNVSQNAVTAALQHLSQAQTAIDRLPRLFATAARLSVVISEVEEWIADEILANHGDEEDADQA